MNISHDMFEACLPWAICVVVAVVVARALVWLSGAQLNLARLRSLHRCEEGSVQSLSFVLTLPFFVMIIMLIIQASHIMIGNIIVQYSAYATVRSGIVWIPALIYDDQNEYPNRISSFSKIDNAPDGNQYRINMNDDSSFKVRKIKSAAYMACMPLGPSRDLGYEIPNPSQWKLTPEVFENLYRGIDADAYDNQKFGERVHNKLAYTLSNTIVDLTFWHRWCDNGSVREVPLQTEYDLSPDRYEYYMNQLGWQDHLTAKVTHNLSLLPGPVRLFARRARDETGENPCVDASGETYIWVLEAEATQAIEGIQPLWHFQFRSEGNQ